MKIAVMSTKIRVSFQIILIETPLSIIAFTMIINHLAGMILLTICIGNGILEIGKMNPESMITGSINPNNESIMAVCCELETVEIRIPSESAVMMNKMLSKASRNRFPCIGIPNTKTPNDMITMALIIDKNI